LAVGLLTDFEEFCFYDCRIYPNESDPTDTGRFRYFKVSELPDNWEWLSGLLSREAVSGGSLRNFEIERKAPPGAKPIGESFLAEIEKFRKLLASDLASRNSLTSIELSGVVQTIIDRVIFLRVCEARGIENDESLLLAVSERDAFQNLKQLFMRADARYNSGLFHDAEMNLVNQGQLSVGSEVLRRIVKGLYPPSPYEFSLIGADVLAQVYEQFLGKVIHVSNDRVRIVDRPEVKKAGGVVYTPAPIVRHMVKTAIDESLTRRPDRLKTFRICDPACGSGSFLVEVFDYLCDRTLQELAANTKASSGGRNPRVISDGQGDWLLSSNEKKRILRDHVFGVDIDPQAVEVTKLSLLLKVLEGESREHIDRQLSLFQERALPDMDSNIICGNSLVTSEIISYNQEALFESDHRLKIRPFDWRPGFPTVFDRDQSGFDVVIGNPPYVLLQDEFRDPTTDRYFREKYRVASYKLDTYHLFLERALGLLRHDGILSFITPTNWMTNNNLTQLRQILLDSSIVKSVEVLDTSAFRGRSVDTAILTCISGTPTSSSIRISRVQMRGGGIEEISSASLDPTRIRSSQQLLFSAGEVNEISALVDRIDTNELRLGSVARVNFGKQLRDRDKHKLDVISVERLSDIQDSHRPCYTGKDVKRWLVEWSGLACLESTVAKRGGCWDPEVQDAKRKILCRQIGYFPEFGLDQLGFQCLNTAFLVTPLEDSPISSESLLGILNSDVIAAYWLTKFWDRRRTFPKIKGTYLKELPLPSLNRADLVEELSSNVIGAIRISADLARAKTPDARVQAQRALGVCEDIIQRVVADLYGLTEAERRSCRAIIEAAVSPPQKV
jgi:type I restriction-modification system DNA methylase subunit